MAPQSIRIIGIDPGLTRMGWGIISVSGMHLVHVEHGVITTNEKLEIGQRLLILQSELTKIIERGALNSAAIEQPFVHKDPLAALKIGYARGIAILTSAQAGLNIFEYTPNYIKKSVVGAGHAQKDQVQFMVRRLLPTSRVAQPDAADALAVAITHAHSRSPITR